MQIKKFQWQPQTTIPKPKLGKIVAVDFDGTLVENKWPDVGEPKEQIVSFVKQLQRAGWRLILWTCRTGQRLDEAIEFCYNSLSIRFDAVNENLPDTIERFGGNPRKINADIYLDDKALSDSDVFDKFWSVRNANIIKLLGEKL